MADVTDAEVEAALEELLHERNSLGDGCFGCGYHGRWGAGQINNNKHHYRGMLRRILEAARAHQVQDTPTPSRPRTRIEFPPSEGTDA